jgi:UDP-N-acetylglucosamine 2-epimerase (non-hydrolysing)
MKILSVVGARPNYMKVAPIVSAVKERNRRRGRCITHVLVHTGQHYDNELSDVFFVDLKLAEPKYYLGVGSGSHAVQTAEVMKKFEAVMGLEKPDVVVVVGDVNSTVACALVASKTFYDNRGTRPLIAHVEAGLRSFDRAMPEEINRVLTDHLSDFLFVSEPSGVLNLDREGIARERIHFVGNTMIDCLLVCLKQAQRSRILECLGLRVNGVPGRETAAVGTASRGERAARPKTPFAAIPFAVLTLHRPSNVDDPENFLNIIQALKEIAGSLPIIFPCHPRTKNNIVRFGYQGHFVCLGNDDRSPGSGADFLWTDHPFHSINLVRPLSYLDFLRLMSNAAIVLTDSGGIQEETTVLKIPCITLRENTERPVTVSQGSNIVAGTDKERILVAFRLQSQAKIRRTRPRFWDGRASRRIVDIIVGTLGWK